MTASLKHAQRAHRLVSEAIRRGELTRQPCEKCGTDKNVVAHHEDYDMPLDVVWLCGSHHRRRHAEIGKPLMEGNDPGYASLYLRDIPDSLVRELRKEAIDRGITVTKLAEEYLATMLNSKPTK